MTQLGMFGQRGTLEVKREPEPEPGYAAEWLAYRTAHPQVFAEFVRLCRAELDAGATYLSAKGVWEQLRRWCRIERRGEYKLDNNHTAYCAEDARNTEPRLVGVMRTRETGKAK